MRRSPLHSRGCCALSWTRLNGRRCESSAALNTCSLTLSRIPARGPILAGASGNTLDEKLLVSERPLLPLPPATVRPPATVYDYRDPYPVALFKPAAATTRLLTTK